MTAVLLAFTFLAASGAVLALFAPSRAEVLARRLRAAAEPADEAPVRRRRLASALARARTLVYARTPQRMRSALEARLAAAGRPATPASVMARKAILLVALGGLFGLLLAGRGPLFAGLGVGIGALLGWRLPEVELLRAAKQRRQAISRDLPEAADLLCTCVEAGLGLDGAMQQVADKFHGPLAEELARYLRDARFGRPRDESLQDLAERADVPELRVMVGAVIQAERLGSSLARVLRVQSADLRQHRQIAARERAMRMPVLLLGPLVGFIFPAVFIVILGPAVLQFARIFHH